MAHSQSRLPVIGFTLDHELPGGYSKKPWYALRENYFASVSRFGAMPIGLPHAPEQAEAYLDLIDGLVVTGGAFDVPPHLYGEASVHEKVSTKAQRTDFEWAVTKGAIDRNMPVLGICGGQQLLNVVLGGTLIQHIPDAVQGALAHEQPNSRDEPGHTVRIVEGTLLYAILSSPLRGERLSASPFSGRSAKRGGVKSLDNHPHPSAFAKASAGENPPPSRGRELIIDVNSAHHQAVAKPAPGCIVNALAEDGVIEGIEYPAHPFCLGVQWHPEYDVTEADGKIMQAFVKACQKNV